jgi:hypothetical protein
MTDANPFRAGRSRSTCGSRQENKTTAREGGDSTGLPKAGWRVARAQREAERAGIRRCRVTLARFSVDCITNRGGSGSLMRMFHDGTVGTGRGHCAPARRWAASRVPRQRRLSLPGSAYLYQGEELGLPEVIDLPDDARQDPIWFRTHGERYGRDGCRVPIPWTSEGTTYGFNDTSASWRWTNAPSEPVIYNRPGVSSCDACRAAARCASVRS